MAGNQDMKAANGTYSSFIATLKWAIPVIVAISAIVVVAIAS